MATTSGVGKPRKKREADPVEQTLKVLAAAVDPVPRTKVVTIFGAGVAGLTSSSADVWSRWSNPKRVSRRRVAAR
jgi:hypothetical protein